MMKTTKPTPETGARAKEDVPAPRHRDVNLHAYGDLFVKYRLRQQLNITFERFLRAPHYYLTNKPRRQP